MAWRVVNPWTVELWAWLFLHLPEIPWQFCYPRHRGWKRACGGDMNRSVRHDFQMDQATIKKVLSRWNQEFVPTEYCGTIMHRKSVSWTTIKTVLCYAGTPFQWVNDASWRVIRSFTSATANNIIILFATQKRFWCAHHGEHFQNASFQPKVCTTLEYPRTLQPTEHHLMTKTRFLQTFLRSISVFIYALTQCWAKRKSPKTHNFDPKTYARLNCTNFTLTNTVTKHSCFLRIVCCVPGHQEGASFRRIHHVESTWEEPRQRCQVLRH